MLDIIMRIFLVFLLCFLIACEKAEETRPEEKPKRILKLTDFESLPGWGEDDFSGFAEAFNKSCHRFLKKPTEDHIPLIENAGTYGDLQKICLAFHEADDTPQALQKFFEAHFNPYLVMDRDNPIGLFTGYYEASLKGSWIKQPPYTIPLHARPDDLVMVNLGEFRDELKGQRIAGRVIHGNLKTY